MHRNRYDGHWALRNITPITLLDKSAIPGAKQAHMGAVDSVLQRASRHDQTTYDPLRPL